MADEIQVLKDFVEGKISDQDFEQQLYTNSALEKLLSDSAINWHGTYLQEATAFLYLIGQDYKNAEGRLNAHETVKLFLNKIGIQFVTSTKPTDDYDLLLSTQPKYIEAEAGFIEKYIVPEDTSLSKADRKQYIKQRYAELFKYQTKPPKWIQNPDWPIRNDKPLYFLGQLDIKKGDLFHDEGSIFLFIDAETGILETIKQLY
ncbi:hypothetical protein B0A69_00100 [Chryseobacterium shigense]|uniref:Uncharacterized protein n=1 Tax=Chryseobacterium shigense TaxID=297244 RepID=A0A1N7I0E9_9FLAO|nr:hypothetical protein [Chryseobacterium shigense]PQA97778.1 hypothetical protein B0A69_00100 [Chryseobacterium shigense]SIS30553.1 hypothetical protein SAMN05421639_101956 [Chryseobacterium shigense]